MYVIRGGENENWGLSFGEFIILMLEKDFCVESKAFNRSLAQEFTNCYASGQPPV